MADLSVFKSKRDKELEKRFEKLDDLFPSNAVYVPQIMAAGQGFAAGFLMGHGSGKMPEEILLGGAYLLDAAGSAMSVLKDYDKPKKEKIKKAASELAKGVGLTTIAFGTGYVIGKGLRLAGITGVPAGYE